MNDRVAGSPAGQEPIRSTVRADLSRHHGLTVLAAVGILCWMAFQWGLGNDVLLPPIAASALDAVDDGETWGSAAGAVAAATVAGFSFWAATQLIDVLVVIGGLRLIPGIVARLSRFIRRKGWAKPYAELSWTTRWAIAYMAGASVLCLVDVLATGKSGVRRRSSMVVAAIGFSAGTIAAIVALTATAAMIGTRIPSLEPSARVFITYAKNPLTWIVIFASVLGVGHLKGRFRDRRQVSGAALKQAHR